MKTPLPEIHQMDKLDSPPHPVGYKVYAYDAERSEIVLFAKLTHLTDVREVCQKRGLTPLDVLVFRIFSDGREDFMFINQVAFESTIWEQVGPFQIEREAYSWEPEPQSIEPKTDGQFTRLCSWLAQTFSFLRFI